VSCESRFPDDLVERYVQGALAEDERAAFEDHYFECATCLERLEAMQALPEALARRRIAPAAAIRPRRMGSAVAALSTLAAAAVLWVTLAPRIGLAPSPPPTEAPTPQPPSADPLAGLRALGRLDPPAYDPPKLRGAPPPEDLASAMRRYTRGDYAAAASGLEPVVRRDPRDATAGFFLGVSYLLTDRLDDGVTELRRTIALGDTPYLEEARLTLARAHLRAGRPDQALDELEQVITLHGDHEDEARELIRDVGRLRSTPEPSPRVGR
jgi:tetratricopeptide (TPR) repeat protein